MSQIGLLFIYIDCDSVALYCCKWYFLAITAANLASMLASVSLTAIIEHLEFEKPFYLNRRTVGDR